MQKLPSDVQSMVQVAIMYYKDRMNQQEIAERMGITRQTVSKLLRNADESNIVEHRINDPREVLEDMSTRLAHRFNLKRALVVPCDFEDEYLVSTVLARYAGEYILELVERGAKRIGLSWGRTVYRTIPNIPLANYEDVTVFPLVGASNQTAPYFMVNEMVRRAAASLNAAAAYAYIPVNPGSKEDAGLFKRTSTYKTINGYWQSADVVVMGIGVNPQDEQSQREAYPGEQNMLGVNASAIAGDILTHYFDAQGNFLENDRAEILCAAMDDLRNAEHVLAIAGGAEKATAILGALRTGIITDIITDRQTCQRLLRQRSSPA